MSVNPGEPRIFTQATIMFIAGVPIAIVSLMMLPMYFMKEYAGDSGGEVVWFGIPRSAYLFLFTFLFGLLFLTQAWWRRFGVDPGRVWTRFGRVFYREARFDEVTRVKTRMLGLKVYSPSGNLNIDSNRFDYALVYLRLLEELQHRRFTLDRTEPTDPNWGANAQAWRMNLSGEIYMDHAGFYDSHPAALAYLLSLTEAPTHYDN
ncbi:MAG: hypothetical protein E7A62_02495 [Actinomycetaceae bacterium]|nr:hypothetical protein [Actinomycetaceae bacterium]MDU0969850.1 hypothetical protein [Actinomycetaceae bacterium]